MNISVTATVTFDYDTDGGLVTNADEALEDVREMLSMGVSVNEYEYTVTEGDGS